MRWQESVSDDFVRLMHSVLPTTKPIRLSGTRPRRQSRQSGQSIWNYYKPGVFVFMPALVWAVRSSCSLSARWADCGRCDACPCQRSTRALSSTTGVLPSWPRHPGNGNTWIVAAKRKPQSLPVRLYTSMGSGRES